MEFEINFRKDEEIYWVTALVVAVIAVLVVFGWIGNGVTHHWTAPETHACYRGRTGS